MTASNKDLSITITLQWEGGYGNDPADPGGPTNWGITIFDARKYWKPNATASDVQAMPKSVAIGIYQQKYWKTQYYDCDNLADGVDLAVFDYGVNSGPSRAYAALMASVGGPPSDTVQRICAYRMNFLRRLGTWSHFGAGWTSRVNGIQAAGLRMAAAAAKTPIPTPAPTRPPVATTPPAAQINIGAIFTALLPALLPIVPEILSFTPLAPFVPLVQAGVNVFTKAAPVGGVTGAPPPTIQKLIADEMYAIAVALDPTLPHTT